MLFILFIFLEIGKWLRLMLQEIGTIGRMLMQKGGKSEKVLIFIIFFFAIFLAFRFVSFSVIICKGVFGMCFVFIYVPFMSPLSLIFLKYIYIYIPSILVFSYSP